MYVLIPVCEGDRMILTGNPFVDTGLMVLAELASKSSVDDLNFIDIRRVYDDGSQLARTNQKLKSYTMVFGTNGPLTQPAYKKAGKNELLYRAILGRLLSEAEAEGSVGERCDLTGIPSSFNFHKIVSSALAELGLPVPERKWVGRDWVPLGGSLGNDAQALPCASRPLHVCALALFALQYLPLGVFLFRGKLACPQSMSTTLSQRIISWIVEKNSDRVIRGDEILGKGEGSKFVLDTLLRLFERQCDYEGNDLVLWLFSNSGTGADCAREPIPERALEFIAKACVAHAPEIRKLFNTDPKNPYSQLFECIRSQRDYPGLYPFKNWPGASREFYEVYQRQILAAETGSSLVIAAKLAGLLFESAAEKERKEIRKPDYVYSPAGRNQIRRVIAENLQLAEYDALFPSSRHPIRVNQRGREYLRFYLAQTAQPITEILSINMKTTHPKIVEIGNAYFDIKGAAKIKNVLDRLARRKLGVRWLQDLFCAFAEDPKYKDFNLGTWDEFVCDREGKVIVFELLFQMRLYLTNKYRESLKDNKETAA